MLIRYRLPRGERFTIEAATRERIDIAGREVMDVEASFVLVCVVTDVESDGVVRIDGRFEDTKLAGNVRVGPLPDVESLAGTQIVVRKGVDGRVHEVSGAEGVEALFGGLTAANALRWFAAEFPSGEVATGDGWTVTDRWTLRADLTPIALDLPLRPEVGVSYAYVLREGAQMELAISFAGGGRSPELGLELDVSGSGTGHVAVDLEMGKLASSVKEADMRLVPRPFRRGALALPELRVRRQSRSAFRP